jgi:hypothetical protein
MSVTMSEVDLVENAATITACRELRYLVVVGGW